jgi:hypothetical protein
MYSDFFLELAQKVVLEDFVKCDWPTQIFRRKKISKISKFSTFNNDIFGKFSVRGKFS